MDQSAPSPTPQRCPTAWRLYLAWTGYKKGTREFATAGHVYASHIGKCPQCLRWLDSLMAWGKP